MEARWLSPRSAATYLDVKVATIYAWASDGTIPGVIRIARRNPKGKGRHRCTVRIDRSTLEEFLKRRSR